MKLAFVRCGAVGLFSSRRGMAAKEGRRAEERERVRWMGVMGVRYDMLGGTDWETSLETGPIGTAVNGASVSEKGVPKRYTEAGEEVWLRSSGD